MTYLMYGKNTPWPKAVNYALAGLRFILLLLLSLVLLNPLIETIKRYVQKPKAVILIDNSTSVDGALKGNPEWLAAFEKVGSSLADQDYEVILKDLNGSVKDMTSIGFDQKSTNLSGALIDIQTEFENSNLKKVLLVSDGIYNQGISPAYVPFDFSVYTVGVGDTIQKDDLVLKNVLFNKISYVERKTPIVAEVVNYGFEGKTTEIEIYQEGKKVASKEIRFSSRSGLQRLELEVLFEKVGMQSLQIVIKPLENEATQQNNRQRIYVDVVDGKQKILLVAPAPHPDIKAISAVMDQNENFELDIFIVGVDQWKEDQYDLAIVHQAYDRRGVTERYLQKIRSKSIPTLLVMDSGANLKRARDSEQGFSFVQNRNQKDNVSAMVNLDFEAFNIGGIDIDVVSAFPPLVVPYGEFQLPLDAKVLFYQKVGSVATGKPLLYFMVNENNKTGYMVGTDFWKWRLQEYALHENTDVFDALFMKTIQYLSTKIDKRKFRFGPVKSEFLSSEVVEFHAELYNDIFERVFDREVSVVITKDGAVVQEASFTPVSAFSNLELSGFEEGSYRYVASVELGDKSERASGTFVVKDLQLEVINQVADFEMLRLMASNTGGGFYSGSELDRLESDLSDFKDAGLIHTSETVRSVINIKWILILLVALLSVEWLIRKYQGGY